jgi:hypothetical protein
LIMQVAASVTTYRQDAGPTVLDKHGQACACGSATGLGGDVGGTDQIPVPTELAGRTGELATCGLGNPPTACGAGRGGAPFVHQPHHDAGLLCLVQEGPEQVGAAPLPQPPVLHPTRVLLGDALGIPD